MAGCGVCSSYVSDRERMKSPDDFLKCGTCPRWLHQSCESKATRLGDLIICIQCSHNPKDETAKLSILTQNLYREIIEIHKSQRDGNSKVLNEIREIKNILCNNTLKGQTHDFDKRQGLMDENIFNGLKCHSEVLAVKFRAQSDLMVESIARNKTLAESVLAQNKLLVECVVAQNKLAAESVAAQKEMAAAQSKMAAAQEKMAVAQNKMAEGQSRLLKVLEGLQPAPSGDARLLQLEE